MPVAIYADEAGRVIATEEYRANADPYTPAMKLPTAAQWFTCLGCGTRFIARPDTVECLICPGLYYRAVR